MGYSMSLKIALAGNPNSGKTTLFNALTQSTQYVGNWPGVTVEKKEGLIKGLDVDATLVDLPGIYSLSPYSLEEVIARDYIINEKPDIIISIVDASNLERNLYLTTQILELGIPVIVALNMMDIAQKRGDMIDFGALQKAFKCEVMPVSAATSEGLEELSDKLTKKADKPHTLFFSDDVEQALSSIGSIIKKIDLPEKYEPRWLSIKLFERDAGIMQIIPGEIKSRIEPIIKHVEQKHDDDSESIIINERYERITKLLEDAYKKASRKISVSEKIDKVMTNRILALPIFFAIMWGVYYISVQSVGNITVELMEQIIEWLSFSAQNALMLLGAPEWLTSLVSGGIISGVGAVLVFVPQLIILYFFISILEDSGYMSRVAFIMDRIFRRFGLSGKSFIPMLISTGCTVPGIMATRTIENESDRRMTIILTPFIPCGAKLPVFAMFASMVFANAAWVGPSMYIVGIVVVIISGLLLKRTRAFAGKGAPFVMELPDYRLPRPKNMAKNIWERTKSFIVKAGTVIFAASAIIWFLRSFTFSLNYLGEEGIELSMLAGFGRVLAPLFAPLGFGQWPYAVATVSGMVAKEMIISSFAVLEPVGIVFSSVSAYAFMVFTLIAPPCIAAVGAIKREMGSLKWTFFAVFYQTGLAYIIALFINQIGSLIFKGVNTVRLTFGEIAPDGHIGSILANPMVYIIIAAVLFLMAAAIKKRTSPQAKYQKIGEIAKRKKRCGGCAGCTGCDKKP